MSQRVKGLLCIGQEFELLPEDSREPGKDLRLGSDVDRNRRRDGIAILSVVWSVI